MPTLVPGHVFVYPALSGYLFDAVFTDVIAWDRQQLAVFGNAFVFVDDVLRHVQQADVRFHSRFLAARLYPQMPVEGNLQVLFREVRHVTPAQTGEAAEDEEVPDKFIAFLLERAVDECRNLLLGQEATLGLFLRDVVGIFL